MTTDSKRVYTAQDVAELFGVSQSKAYSLIREMNAELRAKNYLTVRGRVPASYVQRRFFGVEDNNK